MKSKDKRRKLFIDPPVQGAIVRRIMLHWTVALSIIVVFLMLMQILLDGVYHSLSHHLATVWRNYGLLIVTIVCLFPVFVYDAVKLSHRFAGPMVSFRRQLKRLAEGEEVAPLAFRKKDFWLPLAEDLNRITERIRKLESRLQEIDDELNENEKIII